MIEKTVTYQEMDVDEVREPKGRHMIEFKVAFWIDKVDGEELPRQCWSSGKVIRSANHRHGISRGERNINTIAEVGPAIEDLAAEAEITIHPSVRAKAYAQSRERAVLEESPLAAVEA